MRYKELKKEILKMKDKGQLINNVEISKGVTVVNAEIFVDSIIKLLDHQEQVYKETKIYNQHLFIPKMEKLNNYYIKAKKVLNN